MAQVVSPNIWYPSGYPGSAYDLRTVVMFCRSPHDYDNVRVMFFGDPTYRNVFDAVDFLAVYNGAVLRIGDTYYAQDYVQAWSFASHGLNNPELEEWLLNVTFSGVNPTAMATGEIQDAAPPAPIPRDLLEPFLYQP